MNVTITGYQTKQAQDGRQFTLLEMQGDLEMVPSQKTGRFYATVAKCKVSTTFDEALAKTFVGKQMPGRIVRVPCEPYEVCIDEATGETITLAHRWGYVPVGHMAPIEELG